MNCEPSQGQRKRWIHRLDHVEAVVFLIDLCSYAQWHELTDGDQTSGKVTYLEEFMTTYQELMSTVFSKQSDILLFMNMDLFVQRLAEVPLSSVWPEYDDSHNAEKASKYICSRFERLGSFRHDRCQKDNNGKCMKNTFHKGET